MTVPFLIWSHVAVYRLTEEGSRASVTSNTTKGLFIHQLLCLNHILLFSFVIFFNTRDDNFLDPTVLFLIFLIETAENTVHLN